MKNFGLFKEIVQLAPQEKEHARALSVEKVRMEQTRNIYAGLSSSLTKMYSWPKRKPSYICAWLNSARDKGTSSYAKSILLILTIAEEESRIILLE